MTRTSALLGFFAFLCVSVPLLSLLAGFVPDRQRAEMRHDFVLSRPGRDGGPAYRAEISREERGLVRHAPAGARGGPVVFTKTGAVLLTAAGALSLEPGPEAAFAYSRHAGEDALPLAAALPPHYGEALDAMGQPLRWLAARQERERARRVFAARRDLPVRLAAPSQRPDDDGQLFSRAQRYKALVERFAQRYQIATELIYAIIHNESNFRPGVVSSRQATGLMQLLPSTAGGEVHTFLHGRGSELDADALMNPEENLRYGVAYLHLLLTRHFGDVIHPEAREFCAIAAYNLGPNALLNSFARDRDEAISAINSLSPQEVYERLAGDLPVRETRSFIARVMNSKKEFIDFQ